jgi:hypothetical protein
LVWWLRPKGRYFSRPGRNRTFHLYQRQNKYHHSDEFNDEGKMRAFMKKNLPALLCVILLASSTYKTEAQTSAQQEKQRQAEEIGDRLIQRFHETLDFDPIFKEFFVSDPEMRRLEVELVFGRRLNSQFRNKIDQTAVEKAYVSEWTFWHLFSAYMFTQGKDFQPPPKMEEAYEAITSTNPAKFASGKELNEQYNKKYDMLNNILRKNLTPEAFRSDSYRRNVASIKEPAETADIPQMRRDFYLGKDVKVYVVKREFFNYFLLEEKGALRIFTISLRTKKEVDTDPIVSGGNPPIIEFNGTGGLLQLFVSGPFTLEQIKGEYKIAGRRDSITAEQSRELDKIYGDKHYNLWQLDPDQSRNLNVSTLSITYGIVPEGWKQVYPANGKPEPLIDGKFYKVAAPSYNANSKTGYFTIKSNKAVTLTDEELGN